MTRTTHTPSDRRSWQRLVDTLGRTAFACHARGGRADDVLEDQVLWLQHCLMIEDAADAIRTALPFALAEFVPHIPGGLTISTGAAACQTCPAAVPQHQQHRLIAARTPPR